MTVQHPPFPQLADHLRAIAKILDTWGHHNREAARTGRCPCITCKANNLAARGYPTSTLGDGTGSRSSNTSSSTELAALTTNPFADIDRDLADLARTIWHNGLRLATTIDRITAHATDDDPVPAGTGPCIIRTCGTVCRPDHKRPDNRLRSGLCPACWQAWQRWLKANPDATLVAWRPSRTAALRPKPVAS